VGEGVAGRAPDERGDQEHPERVADREREQAQGVDQPTADREPSAVDEVRRGREAVAEQPPGRQRGQNQADLGVGKADLGPDGLERAGRKEREPLVGEPDEEQGR
jgi:hypothetical protein